MSPFENSERTVAGVSLSSSGGSLSLKLMKNDLLIGLVVAAVAFLVYANSLGNGFAWDDSNIIVSNPALNDSPMALFGGIDSARDLEPTPYYRPLTILSFLIEDRLHGRNPSLMHLFNVLLHSFNAFLVFRIALSLLDDRRTALLAGLLFAVHPINAEGVNFLSGGRNTLLSCACALMAYVLHRRSLLEGKNSYAIFGAVLFLAGLLSKETALGVLPFIVALEFAGRSPNCYRSKRWMAGRLVPYALLTACYGALRSFALFDAGVRMDILPGLGQRVLDNFYIVPRYLLSLVWPPSISHRYFVPEDLHVLALPLAASWLCIFLCLVWLLGRGRSRATIFGLCWLAVFWLPVSGLIPFPSAPLADRFIYVPAIGVWIVTADQAMRLLDRFGLLQRYAAYFSALMLVLLAAATVSRNLDWRDDISLFTRYVQQYPEVAGGHHNLGCAYLDKAQNLELAERSFLRAQALDPKYPRLQTQLGYVYLLRGDFDKALQHYNEAIYQNALDSEALLNRGSVFEQLGRYPEALDSYRRFLAIPETANELPRARLRIEAKVRELTDMVNGR